MASLFNSKHNKYVSIPDWFKDIKPVEEQTIETKTTYISGGSVVSSTSGLSNIAIYNKFVLKDAELDNAALTVKDIALNGIETEQYKIGDEVPAIGWGTTGYVSVAGNSIISIISVLLENDHGFGVIFYDNTLTIIGNVILQDITEGIVTPNNTYYFSISAPYDNASFKVKYYKTETYNQEQLQLSNQNVTDYLSLNDLIPEGKNEITFSSDTLKLLAQPPLSLTKDINNVIKLSVDNIIQNQTNNLTIWGKLFDGKNNIDGDISNVGNISFQSTGKKIGEWGLGAELTYSNAIVSKGSGQSLWLVSSSYTDNNGIVFAKNDKGTRSDEIARINSIGFYPYITDSLSLGTVEKKWNNVYSKKTTIDDIELYQSQTNTLFVDGNLVVSGGITMYGTDGTTAPSIWNGAPKATTSDTPNGKGIASFDSKYFSVTDGHVSFIGKANGSENADTATQINIYGSTQNGTYRVVFADVNNGLGKHNSLYVDSATGAGYNPYTNTFVASYFKGDVNGNINIGSNSSFKIMQDGTARLYMDQHGNFGIKTSSPSSALDVNGSFTLNGTIYLPNSIAAIKIADYSKIYHGVMSIDAGNNFCLGYDSATSSYDTYIDGFNMHFRTGNTHSEIFTLGSASGAKFYLKDSSLIIKRNSSSGGAYTKYQPCNQENQSWVAGVNNSYQYSWWYQNVSSGIDVQKMYLDSSGNLLTTGGITMYSDLRKKTILNHVELSLKEVADAPLIEHYYNSDEAKTTHVGSVAQYWAGLNDWFCKEDGEGFLTMEIQNAALASAISVARELTRYESKTDKQIKKLKKRIDELQKEIEQFKILIA